MMVVRLAPHDEPGKPTSSETEEAIRMTARMLSTVIREMDLIGRYDAHGLCLLLPLRNLGLRKAPIQMRLLIRWRRVKLFSTTLHELAPPATAWAPKRKSALV